LKKPINKLRFLKFLKKAETDQKYEEMDQKYEETDQKYEETDLKFEETDQQIEIFKVFEKSGNGSKI